MEISKRVIIGDLVSHEVDKIFAQLNSKVENKPGLWYAITTAPDTKNLLYVMGPRELGLKIYEGLPLKTLGIAGSRTEAYEIVRILTKEAYDHTNQLDEMKAYLEQY